MVPVTVIVATYGEQRWQTLAEERAIPSAQVQAPVIAVHGDTLAEARNRAVEQASTEWLIHLDGDDQLAPGYVDAMLAADGDLRAPRLVEISPNSVSEIRLTGRDIERTNPCPIGTMIRRETLLDCGGWPEFPAWEDWGIFLRAHRRGATIVHVRDAIYLAHVRPGSRNRTVRNAKHLHEQIRAWA